MKERPILFSGPMVRAILDRRKKQTRRVCRFHVIGPDPDGTCDVYASGNHRHWLGAFRKGVGNATKLSPFGQPGDRLWVRETAWYDKKPLPMLGNQRRVFFVDTNQVKREDGDSGPSPMPLSEEMMRLTGCQVRRPGIHMPRWASRITLEITNVRIERLREITSADCEAEGISREPYKNLMVNAMRADYHQLWDKINAKRGFGWDRNPWVWVIEFKRVEVAQ